MCISQFRLSYAAVTGTQNFNGLQRQFADIMAQGKRENVTNKQGLLQFLLGSGTSTHTSLVKANHMILDTNRAV